jgi:hypothetical protein
MNFFATVIPPVVAVVQSITIDRFWVGILVTIALGLVGFAFFGYLKHKGVIFKGEAVTPLAIAEQKIKDLQEQRERDKASFTWLQEREDKMIKRVTDAVGVSMADLRTFVQNSTGPVSNRLVEVNDSLTQVLAELRTLNTKVAELHTTSAVTKTEVEHLKDEVKKP